MKIANLFETMKRKQPLYKMVSYCYMTFGRVFYVSLAASLLLFAVVAPQPALGQVATTVGFSPVPVEIDIRVGGTTVVNVVIENADNVGAFDIQIDYDPNVALISGWEQGSFLPSAICLVPLDEPGSLKLACAKIGPDGSNGSGTLVSLTFKATALGGNTSLSLSNAELVNAESNQIMPVQLMPGELQVLSCHLFLPLILKQGGPQSLLVPVEALAEGQPITSRMPRAIFCSLPMCAEVRL